MPRQWTQKTYVMVAEELHYLWITGADRDAVERAMFVFAHRFTQDSGKFNRQKFFNAITGE